MHHRVLICAYACHPRGTSGLGFSEDLLGWQIVRQVARFAEVWVITSEQCRPGFEEAAEQEQAPGLHMCFTSLFSGLKWLRRFPGGLHAYDYMWQIAAYFAARRLHRQIGFHAAHHLTYANDWMASYIGAFLPGPYIRGPGGGAHKTPPGFLIEYPWFSRLWERVRSLAQWTARLDPVFVLGQRRAKALLLCNHEARDLAERRWSGKTHFFPVNGVSAQDLAETTPTSRGPDGKFRVISAGTLYRVKGYPIAIRAFARFAIQHPEAEFSILGDGPDEQQLKALAHRLGVESRVHFLGWLPRGRLLEFMRDSDVFLFASLRDGGGAVVVEAMAAAKPVVCLDFGGPGFHVNEQWGIKIAAATPAQAEQKIAESLERLYSNATLRKELGTAGRKRVEDYYAWDALGERLWGIYQGAMGAAPADEIAPTA